MSLRLLEVATVLGITVVVLCATTVGTARAGPGVTCTCACLNDCGGSCPTGSIIFQSDYQANVTNGTVTFWVATGSVVEFALANLSFGPNTSYDFTQATNVGVWTPSTGEDSYLLNFLYPNTTYYYKVTGYYYCTDSSGKHFYHGSTTSSFTTGADDMHAIKGTVYAAGGGKVGAGFAVVVTCVNYSSLNDYFRSYQYTNSAGEFSVDVESPDQMGAPYYNCQDSGDGGFSVQAWNGPYGGDAGGITWAGHWNETIETPAAQWVNFYLPLNYVAPNVTVVLDFSNAQPGYSDLQYTSGTTLTTTLTNDWSITGQVGGAGAGGSGSSSTSWSTSSSSGMGSTNGTLDYIAQWWTTGNVIYNGMLRGWAVNWTDYVGLPVDDGFAVQDPGFVPPTDWLYPGTSASDVYYLKDTLGLPMQNKEVPPGDYYSGTVTTSTTVSSTGGYSWSLGFSVTLPGAYIPAAGLTASEGWSQTTSETTSNTLAWKVQVPNGDSDTCFDVFGQGGSQSTGTADIVGIWSWAPNEYGLCTGG